ncbi:hypothetical protein EC991_009494 [Linnemannia zychae]|nr:hypothetical protein EC991_009494 [Linnemannia zychae]
MSSRDHHRKRDRSRSPAPGGKDDYKDDDRQRHRRSEPSKSSRHRDDDRGDRGDRDRERDRGGDRDKDRGDRHRESSSRHHQSSSSSRRKHNGSEGEEEDFKKRSRRDTEKSADRDSRSSRDKEKESRSKDHRSSKSSRSGRDRDREVDRRSSRSHRRGRSASGSGSEPESGSGSGSASESGSDNASESEEDEMIKKAKSMIKTISEDDYFTKSSEFRLWLRQAKKKYFEDLTADEARKYFKKFVRRWNDFELDESYYKGVRSSQIPTKSMTKYQWKFTKTIDKADLRQVESVKDSIDTMTNIRFANEVGRLTGKTSASALETGSGSGAAGAKRVLGPSVPPPALSTARGAIGPRRPMTADEVLEKEDQDSRSRQAYRAEQKRARKDKEVLLEELVPKATGREAMLEKRRAQTAYHRQERSPDVELPEHDLMGAGNAGDDYKSMLAAEKRRKEAREARRHGGASASGPEPQSSSSSSVYGAAAGPGAAQGGGGGSVLGAKQQAYKEKEAKQMEEFRKLWAQTQAAKGGL